MDDLCFGPESGPTAGVAGNRTGPPARWGLLPLMLLALWGEAAVAVQTGEFQLGFTLPELLGAEAAARLTRVVRSDERVTWEVFVPEAYRREDPPGLLCVHLLEIDRSRTTW